MKQLFFRFAICSFVLAHAFFAFGQNEEPYPFPVGQSLDSTVVWEVGISFAEVADQPSRLFYARMKGFANSRSAIGLHLAFLQRNTNERFGLFVQDPQLVYGEIGLIGSHNFLDGKHFKLGAETIVGYASAKLADRALTEEQTIFYASDDFFYFSQQEVPREVRRNHYFQFKPELVATCRIGRYLGLQAAGGYNFLFGNSRFANTSDFSGWTARAGLVFIIPSDCE